MTFILPVGTTASFNRKLIEQVTLSLRLVASLRACSMEGVDSILWSGQVTAKPLWRMVL